MGVYYRSFTTLGHDIPSQSVPSSRVMIHPLQIFWHSTYRIGRSAFIAAAAALLAVRAGLDLAFVYGLPVWPLVILVLLTGFSAMCVLSLRLHDRGRSGWWSWLILALFSLAWPLTRGVAIDAFNVTSSVLLVFAFIDLALMPGQKGLNRYGPPPKA